MRCENCTSPKNNVAPRKVREDWQPKSARARRMNLCSLCACDMKRAGDDVDPVTAEDEAFYEEFTKNVSSDDILASWRKLR